MTTALPLKNKYCALAVLQNESDVEQFLVTPLLADLGYGPDYLATKKSIAVEAMDKGRKRRTYAPDYLAYGTKRKAKPLLVIDAKHPNEDAESGVEDAQLYAGIIRRQMREPKPDQYCIGVTVHARATTAAAAAPHAPRRTRRLHGSDADAW